MTNRLRVTIATAVLFGLGGVLPLAQQSPREIFQQALALERAQGACEKAIPLYERVVRDAGTTDRALAARALVQLAACQERLGQTSARSTWQRIVRDYSDQSEAAATARARLAATAQPGGTPAPVTDLVQLTKAAGPKPTPVSLGAGLVSPDGRYVATGNLRDDGRWASPFPNLFLRDLQTGQVRILDGNRMAWSGERPGDLVRMDLTPPGPPPGGRRPDAVRIWEWIWSPDSRQIVYSRLYVGNGPPVDGEIRIINIDGSGGRVVVPRASSSDLNLKPVAWSPDGRTIVLANWVEEVHHEIILLDPTDGAMRTIKTIPDDETYWCLGGDPQFSPDGRYLAFSQGSRNTLCDVSVLAIDGSGEWTAVKHAANDEFVGWTSEGDLLFTSDRSGTIDLWLAQAASGRPVGLPTRLASDLGRVMPVGLTRRGDLYYQSPGLQRMPNGGCCDMGVTVNDVFVASVDPATGDLTSTPSLVGASNHGRNHSPSWSADGRYLVYRTRDERSKIWTGVTLLSMETGDERHIRPAVEPGLRQMAPWLTPDGRSLVVANSGPAGTLQKIDLESGHTTPLGALTQEFVLLRSGEAVLLKSQDQRAIVRRSLTTGEDRVVYQAPEGGRVHGVAVSADDQYVAFQERTEDQVRFLIASLTDGSTRSIGTLPSISRTGQHIAWSADGRFLYYAVRPDMRTDKDELWRIPTAGGAAVRLLAVDGPIWNIDVHPSGRYIAFASEHFAIPTEFVLKDFLPKAPGGRR